MRWGKRADMIVHEDAPFNAEPPRSALANDPLTDVRTCYVRNHGPVPEVDAAGWRITVDGRVERGRTWSVTDLRERFETHELTAALQCAGNRRAGLMNVRDIPGEHPWGPGATANATWTGVRLADVLTSAGVEDDAEHVAFEAPDVSGIPDPPQGFGGSIPLAKAMRDEVLLAWAMNGEPLWTIHGAPLRVVVPGYIGARSVKWLRRITVRREPSANFFQATAYRLLPPQAEPAPGAGLSLGPIALNADILAPSDGDTLPEGRAEISGYALAGDDREIARVDVSLDGGRRWRQAELGEQVTPWSWRLWRIDVDLPPGETVITARAWDSSAVVQPEDEAQLWNPKGYVNNGWARVRVGVISS